MRKNISKKKVIFSFNNFANKSFNIFIKNELKNKNAYLYTKNPVAKKFFPKHKIVMAKRYEKSFFENFSNFNNSEVEKFYLIRSFLKSNLFKKFFILIKLFLGYLDLLPSKDNLRKKTFNINKDLENFDEIYCDFRLNEIYSNHEINNYAIKNKKKIICLIFSWDNLFAGDIVNYAHKYYVGSEFFRKTLSYQHKINKNKIKIGKNFPLEYLKLKKNKKIYSNYIIYAFSHSSLEQNYFEEEIEILNKISQYILNINKEIKIIARLYPYDQNKNNLQFKNLKNVRIQNYGKKIKTRKNNNFVYEYNLLDKKNFINNSICVINVFTTYGIESVLLNKPTIFYSLKKERNILQYLNCIDFKLKFMPHFKIIKNKIITPKNNKELSKILENIIKKETSKKFYNQTKELKKIFL